MKILYVDYFQKDGHINFNRIHIDALRKAGHTVDLVLHKEIAEHLPYPDEDYALLLPRFLRFRPGKPLANRFVFLLALLYIRMHIRVKKYDKVFLGCIDEISYSMLPLCRTSYIYAHGNGRFLPAEDGSFTSGATKYRSMKKLAGKSTFIVFNDYMAEPFFRSGFSNVKIISHGCVPPFSPVSDKVLEGFPLHITPEKKIIFHPSGKCNDDFVRSALADTNLHTFLCRNNIYIILRNRPVWAKNVDIPQNILFVDGFLSDDFYRALFLRADAILMCYPHTFHHQVSGVSYECAANGKLILALDTPPLRYIRDWFNYDPLFTDTSSFAERLQFLCADHTECKLTVTAQALMPDYTNFF